MAAARIRPASGDIGSSTLEAATPTGPRSGLGCLAFTLRTKWGGALLRNCFAL
jgi:hypothetical protein